MKRSLRATLEIGICAAAAVILLEKSGLLLRLERLLEQWLFQEALPNEHLGAGQYALIIGLGLAVAWTILRVTENARRAGLLILLLAELLGAAWVLNLAKISFQPLPGMLTALLAAAIVIVIGFTRSGRRRNDTLGLFQGRLSETGLNRLTESEVSDTGEPESREVTFVYCEIGNQAELIEEMSPAGYAGLLRILVGYAGELFLKEGGYLHAADGEGIRVVFGFPQSLENQAAAAARAALAFRDRVALVALREPDSLGKIDLRIGISAGVIVATVAAESARREVVISGEPIEVARRLAMANQIYGSQILLGPRAFSAARAEIVARPLDFLRNGEVHERLEVYELLALTAEATPEEIASRDYFWTGLVYFRERRWSEAFAQFSRARRAQAENDQPLQWYLRRLEPLVLQMATEPAPVSDPLSPL